MQEFLNQPGIKEKVAQMGPVALDFFKHLLVSEGIYARYIKEREAKK